VVAISDGAINGHGVSTRWSHLKRTNRGTQRAVRGTSIAATVIAIRAFCVLPVVFARANPASEATRTVIGTASATTKSELPMLDHSGKI
jgi:hypothetical protein